MKRIFLLLAPVLMLLPAELKAKVRNISVEDGLPSDIVNTVGQDRGGFVYFGTKYGLCRYDSQALLRIGREGGLPFNKAVYDLCSTPGGDFYVATREGLFMLSDDSLVKVPFEVTTRSYDEVMISCIEADEGGNLWVGTSDYGLFRYDIKDRSWRTYRMQLSRKDITGIICNEGVIWALCGDRNIYRYNSATDSFVAIQVRDKLTGASIGSASFVCVDSFGDMWVCSPDGKMFRLELASMHFYSVLSGLSGTGLHSVSSSGQGRLVLGTSDGLYAYSVHSRELEKLDDGVFISLFVDRDGALWAGTYFSGVNYYGTGSGIITTLPPKECGQVVTVIGQMPDGRLALGADDGGLSLFNPADGEYLRADPVTEMRDLSVHSILVESDGVWTGTFGNGLYHTDLAFGHVVHYGPEVVDDGEFDVCSIFRDSDGNLWLGTKSGICRYMEWSGRFIRSLRIDRECDVMSIRQMGRKLYFASNGWGLLSYDMDSGGYSGHYEGDTDGPRGVTSIEVYEGNLYVGTDKGLYVLREDGSLVRSPRWDIGEPLILGMVSDNSGLWLITDGGVLCCDVSRVWRFSREDGFLSHAFTYNSCLNSSSGDIFIGCNRGLNGFLPESLKSSKVSRSIKVMITGISGMDGNGSMDISASSGVKLKSDAADFRVSFVSLDYDTPGNNVYRYRLTGYDDEWHMLPRGDGEGGASYLNVPPGRYVFEVAAAQNQAEPFGESSTLEIDVLWPPLKLAVILLGIFVGIGLVYLVISLVSENEKKKRKLDEYSQKLSSWHPDNRPQGATEGAGSPMQLIMDKEKSVFVEAVIKYIQDNIGEFGLGVDSISAGMNCSRATLFNKLKSELDMSPNQLIRDIRMARALELMKDPTARISDIGYRLGFSSSSYFTKIFRETFGMSPKDYRNLRR